MAKKSSPSRGPARGDSRPSKTQTAFAVPSDRIERGLVTGESQGLLEDYFGPEAYRQLRDLALDASTRSVRGGPRVFILPGIMGSTLARKGLLGVEDTLWIDPVEIALGRLTELTLGPKPSIYHASGVILFTYLKLKLRLKIAGFDADFFPFDWRHSLADLGAALGAALRQDSATEIQLVAHSMGGLVARAALATPAGAKVKRLVMLGTPNYGSYAVVQALRGTYDVVRNLARLDLKHTPAQLADVFGTFPGLHEMLPAPGKCEGVNLYDAAAWPASDPRPHPELLAGVKRVLDKLAPADQRFYLIAGVNQQTTIGVRMENGDFVYDSSAEGDGTVPLAFARLDGIPPGQTWYVEERHGSLPNNGKVEGAVIDVLSSGATRALPSSPPALSRAITSVTEHALRALRAPTVSGTDAYRHLIDSFAAPVRAAAAPPESAAAPAPTAASGEAAAPLQNLVIGRRRQRRLEITLASGSITEADSQAYVLGVFRNVAPSGAAQAIDQRLDGAIADFSARRIFGGDVGELFTLPASRSRLGADLVVFAGLGPFDRFNPDVHQLIAENIVRMMVRSHVFEFATVLIGAGAGQSVSAVLKNLLTGFLRALHDADPRQRFRGVTFCETDPARYAEMKAALLSLAGSALCDDVELTLEEVRFPSPEPVRGAAPAAGLEPIYAMIRQEGAAAGDLHFRVSVLGSGMKAAVVSIPQTVEAAKLDELLRAFDAVAGTNRAWDVGDFGARFAGLMLPGDVREVLAASPERHLVLVHDAAASRIPWETLKIGDWKPGLANGLSRHYLADDLPIATFLEQRRMQPGLKLLLIVDPTQNLPGAAAEGDRILKIAAGIDGLEVSELRADRATKPAVLAALRSGRFDIVHYAGHAFFDPKARGRSGLLLAGDNVLSGADLTGISNLPFLVFFNACQAGRVRDGRAPAPETPAASRAAESSCGVAETMMRGGIANYLSTYWPVRDDAADTFASTFYQGVLGGAPLGNALLDARKAVDRLGAKDWADYILYGSYDFILKRRA